MTSRINRRASSVEALIDDIQQLSPHSEVQRFRQSQALTMALDLGRMRVLLFEQLGSSIPLPSLVVLVFWPAIIFAGFGLFAPRNAKGLPQVSSAPLRATRTQLGQ